MAFSDNQDNGLWVINFDTENAGKCRWTRTCRGRTWTLEYSDGDAAYFLTGPDSVYSLDVASWTCNGANTLNKIGGDGPATLKIYPLAPIQDPLVDPCELPDELTASFVVSGCSIYDGQSRTLTKVSANTWAFSDSSGIDSKITGITFACVNGKWTLACTARCARPDPDPAITFSINTSTVPDLASFLPFQIEWDTLDVTGTPDVGGCCGAGVGAAQVIITE